MINIWTIGANGPAQRVHRASLVAQFWNVVVLTEAAPAIYVDRYPGLTKGLFERQSPAMDKLNDGMPAGKHGA
jgi:hypothetical protein